MEEHISDKEPRVKLKREFDRLLPTEGIEIIHSKDDGTKLIYRDISDIPSKVVQSIWKIIKSDPHPNIRPDTNIFETHIIGKRFRVFIFLDNKMMGVFSYYELLNNSDGYGKNDFLHIRYIFPEYRYSKYVRFAASDLIHFLFRSGTANRIYGYVFGTGSKEALFKKVDMKRTPCVGKIYGTDGPNVQKYMFTKELVTEKGNVVLFEMDAKAYKEMGVKSYTLAVNPKRDERAVEKWIEQIDGAAERIKGVRELKNAVSRNL